MDIVFAGDVFLGGDLFTTNAELSLPVFENADYRVVNLEQAVSDRDEIVAKRTLYTGSCQLNWLTEWRVNVVGLAQNHIHDKGSRGIVDTLTNLNNQGVMHVGAGRDASEAATPHWITDNLALFNYCDFGRKTLTNVQVAGRSEPGVNPLRRDRIAADLRSLQAGQRAILLFHWGVEHLWMPSPDDMALARTLLHDDRVVLIVGSHPHRAQGCLTVGTKKAYFCLGNFLFPNFHIAPPARIASPSEASPRLDVTRRYHAVWRLTYKKWQWNNRVSLLVRFDSKTGRADHEFAVQADNRPSVSALRGVGRWIANCRFSFLSGMIYRLPRPLYRVVYAAHLRSTYLRWALGIRLFELRQRGLRAMLRAALCRVGASIRRAPGQGA